jgi:hypothetical protein
VNEPLVSPVMLTPSWSPSFAVPALSIPVTVKPYPLVPFTLPVREIAAVSG